jgi:hypothetical protein
VHEFKPAADKRRAEQKFAFQIVRAVQNGYGVTWTEDLGYLIEDANVGSALRISNVSFAGNPAQAADALRRLLDADQAAWNGSRAQRTSLRVVGNTRRNGNPYTGMASTYFASGGDHIADRSG